MKLKQVNESLWDTEDGQFRFERGPAKKTAVATDDLLVTLSPNYFGSPSEDSPLRGIDADGARIEIGKPFAFLDWGKEQCWYVYSRSESGQWVERATAASLAEAVAIAGDVTDAPTG